MYCAIMVIVFVRKIFEFEFFEQLWCLGGENAVVFVLLIKYKNNMFFTLKRFNANYLIICVFELLI